MSAAGRLGMSGPQKAAMLMLALGEEHAATLFSRMHEDEIRDLSAAMASSAPCPPPVVEGLCREFGDQLGQTGNLIGSYESTERLLQKTLPRDRVIPDHGGDPRPRRPHHVGQARQRERGGAGELPEERIPADRRGGAVQGAARPRRPRADAAAGRLRHGSA